MIISYSSWWELYEEFQELEKENDLELDPWQEGVMDFDGNQVLRCGRQVGKSEVISRKASKFAFQHPCTLLLIIAASQRQATLLFSKTYNKLLRFNDFVIKKNGEYKEDLEKSARQNQIARKEYNARWGIFTSTPTKTEIHLKKFENWGKKYGDKGWVHFKKNEKYVIYALPAGKTGDYIRGLTVDMLIADEAAYISELVWVAVKPMIAVSAQTKGLGWQLLLSTPFGKGGHFYESCHDSDFKHTHISSESCPRIPRDHLTKEKDRMSRVEYAQEYLGEFVDEFNQYFSTDVIKKLMTFMDWNVEKDLDKNAGYYLGIDPARFGEDAAAFVHGELNRKKFRIIMVEEVRVRTGKSLPALRDHVLTRNKKFNYRKIFNDDTGVGGGLTDVLQEEIGKSKVIAINNASQRYREEKEEKKRGILKQDLYANALAMMEKAIEKIEKGQEPTLEIINNLKLLRSLKSVQYEYTKERNLRIHGKNTHLAEAFVRCCWANKNKGLGLFCY